MWRTAPSFQWIYYLSLLCDFALHSIHKNLNIRLFSTASNFFWERDTNFTVGRFAGRTRQVLVAETPNLTFPVSWFAGRTRQALVAKHLT